MEGKPMNKILICAFVAAAMVTVSMSVHAQEKSLKRIIVFRPEKDAIGGRLISVDDHGMVVLSATREETIPFEEISRIILTGESRSSKGAVYGAVLGAYASVAFFGAIRRRQDLCKEIFFPAWVCC
jgi:hypothetical protein